MATPPTPPDDPLASFKLSLQRYTRKAKVCGRDYVLTERFKNDHLQERDISKLLAKIYHDRPGQPTEASTIYKHSRIVLTILIETGLERLGWLIEVFQRQEIDDGKLPYSEPELIERKILQVDGTKDVAKQVANKFFRAQWRFFAHTFGDRENVNIQAERILPIVDRKSINGKGGTAQLYEIVVLEDFVSKSLRSTISRSAFTPTPPHHDGDGKRYTFALKTFAAGVDGKEDTTYRGEKEAFDGLRNLPGIVRCLGCYKCSEPIPPANNDDSEIGPLVHTNNVLLEFGDMDLELYFYAIEPPVLQEEIENFWKLLFEIAMALNGIHNFESHSGREVVLYSGWHADIKPANILFIHEVFKLADPGFAKFVPKTGGKEPLKTELKGGTWSYGAPETLDPRSRKAVTQAIDIWSLGCVFSEAVSWMIGGSAAVKAFSTVRGKAVGRANLLQAYMKELKSGDCFHDGKTVLKDVLDWHNVLRQSLRKNDNITGPLLDLVENKMLVADPSNRISVQQLVKELDYIIETAGKVNAYTVPENIMSALLTADQSGTSDTHLSAEKQQFLSPTPDLNRQERKLRLLKTPLKKTALRSEVFRSALASSESKRSSRSSQDLAMQTPTMTIPASSEYRIPQTSRHDARPLVPPSSKTPEVPRTFSRHSKRFSTASAKPASIIQQAEDASDRCDIFKARKVLEKNDKNTMRKVSLKLRGKDSRDAELSRHFEERDIIFLVDNAASMIPYWENAEFVLTTLVWMCVGQDKDGMDLRFTSGDMKLRGSQNRSEFEKCMNKSAAMPSPFNKTDITNSLGNIFHKHLLSLRSRGGSTKALTVIVLTDGRWDGMTNKDSVKAKIASFVREVIKTPMEQVNRPVSIQFIQFGRDYEATLRLGSLDDDLKDEMSIPDVIDHEPADGDAYKMILGSFVHDYDRRNRDVLRSPMSPPGSAILDQPIRESPSPDSSP